MKATTASRYGGKVSENHTANFIEGMRSRQQPISDVWSHNRMLEICHLSNIAMPLGRELRWDPVKREVIGDSLPILASRPHVKTCAKQLPRAFLLVPDAASTSFQGVLGKRRPSNPGRSRSATSESSFVMELNVSIWKVPFHIRGRRCWVLRTRLAL